MFDDDPENMSDVEAEDAGSAAAKGDGMHHHEIHEDEGGGYFSKHTHPDGRQENENSPTYEDAKRWQDERFGHGEQGDDAADDGNDDSGGDDSMSDMAESYNRSCK
jgi:hypothetical protein